jgi:glycosyltransferase involved in cell wall biosynthesis
MATLPVPKILDATDSISAYLRGVLRHGRATERVVSALELIKMPGFEARAAEGYCACIVSSAIDAEALRRSGAKGRLEVVPNGVWPQPVRPSRQPDRDSLLFFGNMYYAPNADAAAWFVRRVLPLVRAVRPDVKLRLVGRDPVRSVRRLAGPGVEVTGGVPELQPYLRRSAVFVAPMRIGGGFPNKVAEALSAGLPTVATSAAHAGIPGLRPGEHLLQANDPAGFSEAVVRLLGDPALGRRLGEAGHRFIVEGFGWNRALDLLEAGYRRCIEERRTAAGPPASP